ncbi:MAG TPA: hypothetical protein VF407_25120 [Polyangiaceae bacterium]
MTTTTANESKTTVEATPNAQDNGLVGTVLELGFAWAAYGLKLGTTALEQTSKTLDLAAHSLDKLSTEFAKKSRVQVESAEAAK